MRKGKKPGSKKKDTEIVDALSEFHFIVSDNNDSNKPRRMSSNEKKRSSNLVDEVVDLLQEKHHEKQVEGEDDEDKFAVTRIDNYVDGDEKLKGGEFFVANTSDVTQNEVELMSLESSAEIRAARSGQMLIDKVRENDYDGTLMLVNSGANISFRNVFGQEPIYFAAHADDIRIIQLLLDNGANSNSVDNLGIDALTIAFRYEKFENARKLLQFNADPITCILSLSDVKQGVRNKQLEAMISDDILCHCPNPILTCFKLSYTLNQLSQRQEERHSFYQGLRDRARCLAVNLLSCCKDMWDVRRLFTERTTILGQALKYDQTLFIAHPYCQEYLKELWLGKFTTTYGFSVVWLVLRYLAFPILFPIYFIQYLASTPRSLRFSRLGDYLELCNTPFIKFSGSMISFVAFLALLVIVITNDSNPIPSRNEVIFACWIVAMVLQEFREMYQTPTRIYLSSLWNLLDVLNLGLYSVVIALRAIVYLDRQESTGLTLFVANLILSAAAFLSGLRFLNVLEAHHRLGPLQISIRQIIGDLLVFLGILVVFVFSFAVAATKIYQSADSAIPSNGIAISSFATVDESLRTMFWSIFGLIDVDVLSVDGWRGGTITRIGEVVYGCYMVMVFVLLINLFIAVITNTYQRVADNSDVVWKFARARLIREVVRYPAVPTPLNLIAEPITLILRLFGITMGSSQVRTSSDDAEEDAQLAKLNLNMVERHLSGAVPDKEMNDLNMGKNVDVDDIRELKHMISSLIAEVNTLKQKVDNGKDKANQDK
eukprot:m.2248 g.2248  ORF g.2248 m.2248 type:complete len:771 (+) comp1742_c0_seq1:59-2371(+)